MTTHNISAAQAISSELGFTVASEDADAMVRFIRNAYHRGALDALPMRDAMVAEAVAAEREACAQLAEQEVTMEGYEKEIAAAIRERGAL